MTDQGQKNSFDLDIVYAIPTMTTTISAPILSNLKIPAASVENIISDKLSACQRFKSGNTRLKDFDDLWRICESRIEIDYEKLKNLLTDRDIRFELDKKWITKEMNHSWHTHQKKNDGLPELTDLFDDVNVWLKKNLTTSLTHLKFDTT